jgi:alpha-1,3-glucosyltransferase
MLHSTQLHAMDSRLIAAIVAALLVRHLVSLWPYSGQGDAPTFGDYEAQRHWMELTLHLPVRQWYWYVCAALSYAATACCTLISVHINFMLHRYDADYWRLDYPPLSAWQSWICGAVSHALLPESVQLMSSRGFETGEHKVIMRAFVIGLDVLVWFPAVLWTATKLRQQAQGRQQHIVVSSITIVWAALGLPVLILIDHGHYQFNCVCVGLALAGATAICSGKGSCACFGACLC